MRRRDFFGFVAGASAGWTFSAGAQQPGAVNRIGFLLTPRLESPEGRANSDAFRRGLAELRYVEGQNIVIEARGANGDIDRLPDLASELVDLKVDILVAGGTPAGRAAKRATATIPIVAIAMGDPIQDGLVTSLARPGGNLTGTTFLGPELVPKRLGLFKELLPRISRVAVLWHPTAFSEKTTNEMVREVSEAAKNLNVQLQFVEARSRGDFEQAFQNMIAVRADGLFEFPSPMFFAERGRLVELAALHRIPAMYNAREFVHLGGLFAYGSRILDLYHRSASYVDKILKGAKPSDLPIEQPTKFELYINLKTARSLGIDVPLQFQQLADEVIE